MNVTPILQQLDAEISRLQSAREAIAGLNGFKSVKTKSYKAPKRHTMSAAARRRIAAAQRERWARLKRISKAA